jgi:hypothetical protein
MAHGRLRALGNSIHLKNKFGAGYRISLVTSTTLVDPLKQQVMQYVPQAILEDSSAGALIYQIPNAAMHLIPPFVRYLESMDQEKDAETKLVKGWSISQTTLVSLLFCVWCDMTAEHQCRRKCSCALFVKLTKGATVDMRNKMTVPPRILWGMPERRRGNQVPLLPGKSFLEMCSKIRCPMR